MEHFLSMPNGLQRGGNICIRWKPVLVTTSDWLRRYYQIMGSLFLYLFFFLSLSLFECAEMLNSLVFLS